MTGLLQVVASAKPREKAGAHTMARYGFQVHVSILKMLELHRSGSDYRAAFDHFDDLMVFDKADQPEEVAFFQIKSQTDGAWTLKQMTRKQGKGKPPVTFLGRLHHHMATFGQMVTRLGFVSNLAFRLKLPDETETTPDHHVIRSTDLHSSEIAALKAAVTKDAAKPPTVDGSHLFVFERTIGLMDQDGTVKGRILDFVNEREGSSDHIPLISLYETLRGSVLTKSSVTQEFTTTAEFYDRKTLCRADIEAMFWRATAGKRFHDNWQTIQRDLIGVGMNTRDIVRLQNSAIRYINARAAGESGATAFNAAAHNAIAMHQADFDACSSVPEIADRLDKWAPSDYEHRHGALYVEAFEAME
jgi:Cap4, dsDNA endonuclease domain